MSTHTIPGEPQPSEAVLEAQRENVWTIERCHHVADLYRHRQCDEAVVMFWLGVAQGLWIAERQAKGK